MKKTSHGNNNSFKHACFTQPRMLKMRLGWTGMFQFLKKENFENFSASAWLIDDSKIKAYIASHPNRIHDATMILTESNDSALHRY